MTNKRSNVHGIGINDYEESTVINGQRLHSYYTWYSMLCRCYSIKSQIKRPTYIGCTVCDEWKYFSNFKKWYDENYREGFHLDKDILIAGNKIYSPDTCRFIPPRINTLLLEARGRKSGMPLGITEQKPNNKERRTVSTFTAQCQGVEGERLSKTFKTIEEASAWYSATKTRVVREVATIALEAGDIQQDIFDALVSRKF